MKKILLLILVFPLIIKAQLFDSAWLVKNYTKKEVLIPMRDGINLFTSCYIPKNNEEKHPILLTRTPYSCAPYGENQLRNFQAGHWKEYLLENYIIITQDVRGRWMSEGEFLDVRPYNPNKKTNADIDESSDTYDAIDWMIKNIPNNNGKVGVKGTSYPGFYSTMAALSNHPALKAVSPQAPVTEWFLGDDFHHNGAFMLMDAFAFYSSFGKPRPMPTTKGSEGFNYPTKDGYEFYLRTGALTNFTKLMGDSIAFWKDLMSHPNYDAFWKARNPSNFVQNISADIPTLIVGGVFDAEDCYGAWNLYKAINAKSKNNNKIVMGPWYHGQWSSGDGTQLGNVQFESNTAEWFSKNMELPFFNYYLKGKGNITQVKEANIFFTGANKWVQSESWPIKGTGSTKLYLQNDGMLSLTPSKFTNISFSEYTSDPAKPVPYTEDVLFNRSKEYMTDDQRFAARRTDVLVYQTETLSEDISFGGELLANLKVSISSTDADFVVKLIDVFPDDFSYATNNNYNMNGYQMLVRGEVMRGKFRESFEKPFPFIPNKPTLVKFALPDIAHTFKKGHKIMVQIQSSWFPLVDRNPQQFMDIYKATNKDFKKAVIRIYNNESFIQMPIIKK